VLEVELVDRLQERQLRLAGETLNPGVDPVGDLVLDEGVRVLLEAPGFDFGSLTEVAPSKVTYDRDVWNDLVSLRFLDEHAHVAVVGPVGTGKTFLAHALGHIAARRGHSVLAVSADHMLKGLKHVRLDNSHGQEMKKLVAVDLLIVDDFALDVMDHLESRDVAELMGERHRAGSVIVTSNRGPDEWLVTFADPVRAQSTIDRFVNNAYDLVIDRESYRPRLKPNRRSGQTAHGR
jgi:DNA replication protein DnaC